MITSTMLMVLLELERGCYHACQNARFGWAWKQASDAFDQLLTMYMVEMVGGKHLIADLGRKLLGELLGFCRETK